MKLSDFFWIAAGFALGAIAGAFGTVKAFLRMHRNSLPPKDRK